MNNWEQNVRRVIPYTPGEQPGGSDIIKLNTNENPFPPSAKVQEIIDNFHADCLKLYPQPDCRILVNAIAKRYGVKPSQVFTGVGSDDVLSMAFLTFFNSDKPVLFPDITYSFYDVWCDVYGISYKAVPLKADFTLNTDGFLSENGGIVIANPNAPTGICAPVDTIEQLVKSNPDSVVIVDEAYIDFGGESCLKLTEKYENLLVVQTFSKSRSMAGMRIGFAIGNEKLIKYMSDVKFSVNSYTMSTLTLLTGSAAIEDEEYFRMCCAEIVSVREYSKQRLSQLGFEFTDSKSNFIFASHPGIKAKDIFEALKKRDIYVRYFDKPRIDNYLRITVGTREQMDRLLDALEEIL